MVLGGNVVSHLDFYVVIYFPNRPIEQSSCGLTVEILFAAVVADFSRDVFDNDDFFVVSERKDSTPGLGFPVPANDTLHSHTPQSFYHSLISPKWPAMAAAAAISGPTKCVRPPLPCQPYVNQMPLTQAQAPPLPRTLVQRLQRHRLAHRLRGTYCASARGSGN